MIRFVKDSRTRGEVTSRHVIVGVLSSLAKNHSIRIGETCDIIINIDVIDAVQGRCIKSQSLRAC
jgi:hypothetical protein